MIRRLITIVSFFLYFSILLAGLATFLLTTTPGLHTLINLSRLYIPGTFTIHKLHGNLLNEFNAQGIIYQNKELKIKIAQLNMTWHPSSLKNHSLMIQWENMCGSISPTQLIKSPVGALSATTSWPDFNLTLNSKLNSPSKAPWQFKTNAQGTLPWNWNFTTQLSQIEHDKHGGLNANLSARGVIKSPNEGHVILTLHPGHYQLGNTQTIAFKGGDIHFDLSAKELHADGILSIDPHKNVSLQAQFPGFTLSKNSQPTQAIHSQLKLEISSLDFLQHINPDISQLKGQLMALIYVNGTFDKFNIQSQAILSKTSLVIPKLGLNLDAIDLKIDAKEKNWIATGSLASAGHRLLIKGMGSIAPDYVGDVSLTGTDFPLIKTNEYQVTISPQLKLHLSPTLHVLSGSVAIPYAQIKPQSFTNSYSLPDEVIYKKQDKRPASPIPNSSMEINIQMGDNVEVNVKGLKGHLGGTLHVKQQPQGSINAYGELTVIDGTYKAYGQELAIKQGELIFTGGTIENPGITVRATKKINTTSNNLNASQAFDFNNNLQNVNLSDSIVLGVEVSGRLRTPKIQLFSKPAILSQADILSMLVLGRPANQANKAGGQLLLAAISSMNIAGTNSTQLLDQLKQSTGIDFNVQTNTNYNQTTNTVSDSTAVVVGKSLSKRLYLSYNIALSQSETNMLTLKYILNKFFSIQVSNSINSSAIDFLYTANKKAPRHNKINQDKTS